ncbi:MAG: IPT/TIG domain-containing protein [Actinoplanes sp.]
MTQPSQQVTGLARRFAVEIDMVSPAPAIWSPLPGVEELKPTWEQRREKDEDYDDAGAERETVTGSNWKLEIKLIHRAGPDGVTFNPVQEFVRGRAQAEDSLTGEIHVRWFDRSGVGEAWDGRALATWQTEGGNGGARDMVTVVLSGQGKRIPIVNPNGSPLPVVAGLAPTGGPTAGGTLVEVRGRKLTGATAVTFGGVAATSFRVVSDSLIVATAPATTAGAKDVIVTTPGGVSANTAVDNFLYA